MRLKPSRSREAGQAITEFALVFPIVFLVILIIIELGFAFNAYQTVVFAARSGARAGAVYLYQNDCDTANNDLNRWKGEGSCASAYGENIRATVLQAMPVARGFDPDADIVVTYNPATPVSDNPSRRGDELVVTVTYDHGFLTPLPDSATITLTGTASHRIER